MCIVNPFSPPLQSQELNCFSNIISIEPLTSGGEGSIFTGFIPDSSKKVAIKIYGPDRLEKRTQLEIEKLKAASCNNIVSLLDYGNISIRESNCLYLITEFIYGNSLNDILSTQGSLSAKEISNLIINICNAIRVLWNLHVVHCDITPNNIIRNTNGVYILIDLGIAKHLDAVSMTQPGCIFGTTGYIAPEQLNGRRNLTFRADLYSLGIVSYQCLTGYHPFNFRQELMMTMKVPRIPSSIEAYPQLIDIIYNMTDPVAYKRPATFEEIISCIREAL